MDEHQILPAPALPALSAQPAQPVQSAQPSTCSVVDVAERMLELDHDRNAALGAPHEGTHVVKLHCLLYFSQAHHLAVMGRPLFFEELCAGPDGPFCDAVAQLHEGLDELFPGDLYRTWEWAHASGSVEYADAGQNPTTTTTTSTDPETSTP